MSAMFSATWWVTIQTQQKEVAEQRKAEQAVRDECQKLLAQGLYRGESEKGMQIGASLRIVSGRGRDLQRVPALGTQHSQTTSTPDYLEVILQLGGRPNVMTMMKVVRCDSGGNAMGCTQIGLWIQLFIVKACQTRLFMLIFSIFWLFFLVKHSHLWLHERKQHLCHLMLVKPPFSLANPNIACGSSIPIHG